MEPSKLAALLGIQPNTIRRYSKVFKAYLTPAATPQKGKTRYFSRFDQRVIFYVSQRKRLGDREDQIIERLEAMKNNDWSDLPDLPPEFSADQPDKTYDVVPTIDRARELATVELLQAENRRLISELDAAQARETDLKLTLAQLKQDRTVDQQTIHALEIELERATGQVNTLQARLGTYSIGQGDQPVSLAILIAVVAGASTLLILLVFVLARLLL